MNEAHCLYRLLADCRRKRGSLCMGGKGRLPMLPQRRDHQAGDAAHVEARFATHLLQDGYYIRTAGPARACGVATTMIYTSPEGRAC